MKPATHTSYLIPYITAVAWLILLALYILAGTPLVPFHGDESTQIYMSRDYAYQFIQRDLSLVMYGDPPVSPTEQDLRLLNGTINKYLIGLAWHIGGFALSDINEQWDWSADWDYNQRTSHAPTEELLLLARWPSALFLAAGIVPMFALGWTVGGSLTAYLASLYYALNPALLLNGRRAMMEGSTLFFGLLVVLAGIWFLQKRSWWSALLLGVSGGLALASKHSNIFVVVAVFGIAAMWLVKHHLHVQRSTIVRWLAACALALAIFYLLNPAWWDNPTARVGEVLHLRQELLDTQVNVFGGYSDAEDRVAGFLRQSLFALPQYYEALGWENHIGDQITRYETSVWRGVSIGGSLPGAVLMLGMIVLGMGVSIRDQTRSASIRWLVVGWVLAVTLSTLLLTPLEWQRYYLLVYPIVGLFGALGLSHLFRRITS